MDTMAIIKLIVMQMFAILAVVFIIAFFLILKRTLRLQKKFLKYTIKPLKNDKVSFFDKIEIMFEKINTKHTKFLSKFKSLEKSSKKYEKHLSFEDLKNKTGMNIVSYKFLIGYIISFLYIVSKIIHISSITILGIVISFLIGYYILDIVLFINYIKRRKEVEEDLLKAIIIMNNSFKSGRSTMQAVEIVKNELTGAISDEFKKIHLDISYGLSLEVVFERFYDRIKIEDAKYISSSLSLLNKTGGNIIKVFNSIETEFYNRKKLENELKSLTASSNFVFKLLLVIPFVLYTVIFLLNKDYFNPFFETILGKILFLIIITLYSLYVFIVMKVMRLEE